MSEFKYPRVSIVTNTVERSTAGLEAEDTSVLFAPFIAEKGPINEIKKIYSLNEFVSLFGNISYEKQGQNILNIINWLNSGGTVYALRLVESNSFAEFSFKEGEKSISFSSKYPGEYYNKLGIILQGVGKTSVDISVVTKNSGKTVYLEIFRRCLISNIESKINNNSQYIKNFEISEEAFNFLANSSAVGSYELFFETAVTEGNKKENQQAIEIKVGTIVEKIGSLFYDAPENGNLLCVKNNGKFSPAVDEDFTIDSGIFSVNNETKIFRTKEEKEQIPIDTLVYKNSTDSKFYDAVEGGNLLYKKDSSDSYEEASDEDFITIPEENGTTFKVGSETDIYKTIYIPIMKNSSELFTAKKNDLNKQEKLITDFFNNDDSSLTKSSEIFDDTLNTKIDLILDAGFSQATKEAMAGFIFPGAKNSEKISEEPLRNDIILILDSYENILKENNKEYSSKLNKTETNFSLMYTSKYIGDEKYDPEGNINVYEQKFLTESTLSGNDIWVTPTYFLASLIPYNDLTYGIQFPTAGLTRGVLQGVKEVQNVPTRNNKNEWFKNRFNYAEKDGLNYIFMAQRTFNYNDEEEKETGLSFLNNARVKNKMVRELESLARWYLHEFNDSTTLGNMSSVLNRYVNDWIQNRTLSYASVEVEPGISEEEVNIKLNIKFTGTIEIITIDITIE